MLESFTNAPNFIVKWFDVGNKLSLYNREWYFLKTSLSNASKVTSESMEKWKSFILTVAGLGIATGMILYLYRDERNKDGAEENSHKSSASQVMVKNKEKIYILITKMKKRKLHLKTQN